MLTMMALAIAMILHLAVAHEAGHRISKRQLFLYTTSDDDFQLIPQFAKDTYRFTLDDCSAGVLIAIITATDPVGNNIAYAVDTNSGLTSTNVAINYITGQLNLATTVYDTFTVIVRATNNFGGSAVPVTITCAASTTSNSAINTVCFNGLCYNNATGGSVYNNVRYVCFDGNCYPGSGSASAFSSGGTFSSGYLFSTNNCTSGTSVGTVSISGATAYTITGGSGGFSVSSAGLLTLANALSAGTYNITVAATTASGSTLTTTVSITVNCGSTSIVGSSFFTSLTLNSSCLYTNCNFNYAPPVFAQSVYAFSQSNCTAGQTIGTVTATNAVGYYIETGGWSSYFTINSTTGVISSSRTVPVGTNVTFTVTAFNGNGVTSHVALTVNYTGCVGAATTNSLPSIASSSAPAFGQTSYFFTLTSCTTGATVGSVTANGATQYTIGSNQFSINSAGAIITTTVPTTGTYYTFVTAVNGATGATSSVTIIITAACTASTPTFTSSGPFSASSCAQGTAIGSVSASNAIAYGIDVGSSLFNIGTTTGVITVSGTSATSGTYTLPVRAYFPSSSTLTSVIVTLVC